MKVKSNIRVISSWIAGISAVLFFPLDSEAGAQSTKQGLIAHYYGQRAFFLYAGKTEIESLRLTLDLNRLKWPPHQWSKEKKVFSRDGGWSIAIYGLLQVKTPDEYRFKYEGLQDEDGPVDRAELWVNGRRMPLNSEKGVHLEEGQLPVSFYVKSKWRAKQNINLNILWRRQGVETFEEIDPALLSYSQSDAARTSVVKFDIEFKNGGTPCFGVREYEIELPKKGFYEFIGHFRQPYDFDLFLDGHFLCHGKNKWMGYKWSILNTARTVRYLEKGKHVVRLYGYTKLPHEGAIESFLQDTRFGVSLIPDNPEQTLTITEKNRDDMVFRRNKPLTILIEQATEESVSYSVEVTRQREKEVVWSAKAGLPANKSHAVAEVRYPCNEEGAFEYRVKNEDGDIMEGAWAFVVVDPTPVKLPNAGENEATLKKVLIDAIDCTMNEDPVHKFRDNGTSRVVEGPAGRYRVTGYNRYPVRRYVNDKGKWRPARDGDSRFRHFWPFDWFAYTLRVRHPGKPHMLTAYIPTDARRLVILQAHDHVTGNYNGGVLFCDNNPESRKFSTLSFPVWPNTNAMDISVWCMHSSGHEGVWQGAVARIELYELPDGLPPLPRAANGWTAEKQFGWRGEQIDIGIDQNTMPPLWPGSDLIPGSMGESLWYDWKALWTAWERYGQFARYRGDNLLIWPAYTYGWTTIPLTDHMLRCREAYGEGFKFRCVDRMWRDIFKMRLLICEKYGVKLVADFMNQMFKPHHVLATDKEGKYTGDGIFLNELGGKQSLVMSPVHPLSRKYMIDFVGEIARKYGKYSAFGGINIRMWLNYINTSGMFGSLNRGYDDFAIGIFEQETGVRIPVGKNDPERFEKRKDYLLKHAKDKWLDWRCEKVISLRKQMLAELKKYAPGARLYADIDPRAGRAEGVDTEKIKGDLELEYSFGMVEREFGEKSHIECSWLDPVETENFDIRLPESLRRTLANMEKGNRPYPKPMCAGSGAPIRPYPYELAAPARALAEGKLETITYGGQWLLPTMDEGLRKWVQAWRAIPEMEYKHFSDPKQTDEPIACWHASRGKDTVFYLVNRTAREQTVETKLEGKVSSVSDLVSGKKVAGGNKLKVTIGPFMIKVFSADGGAGISGVEAIRDKDLTGRLEDQISHLRKILKKGKNIIRVLQRKGERYLPTIGAIGSNIDDGGWAFRDKKVTIRDIFGPIDEAWSSKDYTKTEYLLEKFLEGHSWWYQAFGWPDGIYNYILPVEGPYSSADKLIKALDADVAVTTENVAGVIGNALVITSGKMTLNLKVEATARYGLRFWMVSGKGYGPVDLIIDGKHKARIGTGDGKSYFAHFTTADPVGLMSGVRKVTLRSHGKQGLIIQALELDSLQPQCIKKWSTIGLFDKGGGDWDGFDKVFPPENTVDLSASYKGMDGETVRWKQIDIGDDRFIQLLEKYYPYRKYKKMNAVAYLANWIYSPDERVCMLYYGADWCTSAWINDEIVLDKASGPWPSRANVNMHLRKGWNKLLIKSVSGTSSWKAYFAVSDPGDLKYSPVAPGHE